ncbi:unknown [Crocosphaera subtropica ATCC 51142]|uniref:Uncharacterized protein n=1 Tax=Crocosphaera subtropica (strain ATCC 51142 / BH68) TaxID=43989 RepID=B1WXF5_CROS5|nr:hypothetical protein [Crocosphaera subtropica]ACB52496.1 unknown [Crocosphaera subtropica ATCC 51142]
MPSLTLSEITYYRSQLADYPDAIIALDEIVVCDGDLDDAAINLALSVGQTPDRTDWLEGLAKRYRVEICQENLINELSQGHIIPVINHLMTTKIGPDILVLPVVLYVLKTGVDEFCSPLNLKIT